MLMIGGAGAGNWLSAAGSTYQGTFVNQVLNTMDSVGADGLDLDWEPLTPSDYSTFAALATALRNAHPNMILTMPVGWINPNYQVPDPFYGMIAPLFDQINILLFDSFAALEEQLVTALHLTEHATDRVRSIVAWPWIIDPLMK